MNSIQLIKQAKIQYSGTQNSVLKYLSMRSKMNKPVVTADEILDFFQSRITRKDTLVKSMQTLIKHNFVKKQNDGYVITNLGKEVPFVVASSYQQQLARKGQRVNYAHDWDE